MQPKRARFRAVGATNELTDNEEVLCGSMNTSQAQVLWNLHLSAKLGLKRRCNLLPPNV